MEKKKIIKLKERYIMLRDFAKTLSSVMEKGVIGVFLSSMVTHLVGANSVLALDILTWVTIVFVVAAYLLLEGLAIVLGSRIRGLDRELDDLVVKPAFYRGRVDRNRGSP